jgi:murein DD-endopeptidase MepM/ murein hydrolase activator NlpD
MRKNYFIVVLAHSTQGRIKRLHIPHYAVHIVLSLALFGSIAGIGLFSSYGRMFLKVSELNQLRAEKAALELKYGQLVELAEQRDVQLESLGNLATEVSIAFGIKRQEEDSADVLGSGIGSAGYSDSYQQFDFLQQVQVSSAAGGSPWNWLENTTPSIWPVQGRLSSSFGKRLDPFLGKGAFHSGVDLTARHGAPVVAAADGVVSESGWSGRYGKRIMIRHGHNALSSYYAHLSEYYTTPGQVVRRGEVIGRVGRTGRTTAAHVHYEVRYRGTPVNPYKYLRRASPRRASLTLAD